MVELSSTESAPPVGAADHPCPCDPLPGEHEARLRGALRAHFAGVWRTVQALGVPSSLAEDVAQKTFLVFSEKLEQVRPGTDRAFLMATAVRMAANVRRQLARRSELPSDGMDGMPHCWPDPEHLLQSKQARDLLEGLLSTMPREQREVFVLFELEQLSLTEVADALGVPRGTAASRLRAARTLFEAGVQRLRCRQTRHGGQR